MGIIDDNITRTNVKTWHEPTISAYAIPNRTLVNYTLENRTDFEINKAVFYLARANVAPVASASLTPDGNVTLQLEEGKSIPYNEKFSVEYTPYPEFSSRWNRRIGDAFQENKVSPQRRDRC